MKKVKGYTSIWAVEKVIYTISNLQLPFPVAFNQMARLVLPLLFIIVFVHVPPLSVIEGALLRYLGIPVMATQLMSQKTFDGKRPLGFLRLFLSYHSRFKATFVGKKVKEQKE